MAGAENVIACGGCGPDVTSGEVAAKLAAQTPRLVARVEEAGSYFDQARLSANVIQGYKLQAALGINADDLDRFVLRANPGEILRDETGAWVSGRGSPIEFRPNDFILMIRTPEGNPVFLKHGNLKNAVADLCARASLLPDAMWTVPENLAEKPGHDGKVPYAVRSETLHLAVFRPTVSAMNLEGEIGEGTAPLKAWHHPRQIHRNESGGWEYRERSAEGERRRAAVFGRDDFILLVDTAGSEPIYLQHRNLRGALDDLSERAGLLPDARWSVPRKLSQEPGHDGTVPYLVRSEAGRLAVFRSTVSELNLRHALQTEPPLIASAGTLESAGIAPEELTAALSVEVAAADSARL